MLRIKEVLKEKKISGKVLAEHLGITENSVSLILNNKRQPRFETLSDIASYLKVDVRELFISTKSTGKALNGFVEYEGTVYKIESVEDLKDLLKKVV
jgi:transcriptional regulator with XRE-family HTH domain